MSDHDPAMKPRERFLVAMSNGVPDRVPVAPDFSNYIPCKRTGLPFWDIYFREEIPLWQAYLETADYFGIDAWVASCCAIPLIQESSNAEKHTELIPDAGGERMIQRITYRTPDGELQEENICLRGEPPTRLTRVIKDLATDWRRCKWLLSPPTRIDLSAVETIRQECGVRNQAFGLYLGYPGFHSWQDLVEGGIEQLSFAYADTPAILDEWFELDLAAGTRLMELLLSVRPDYVLFGGSGTLTLASPELAERYAIPALRRWSRMAHDAGVPSMLHSCGRSRALVDMLVEHTVVDCVNPLEVPPMGDVDLAELKEAQGRRIALMGNLHTTSLMLHGSPEQVYAASVRAIRSAGDQGGFILSTGDQCGPATPDENIFAMVAAAEDCGYYDKAGKLPATQGHAELDGL